MGPLGADVRSPISAEKHKGVRCSSQITLRGRERGDNQRSSGP